MPPRKRKFILRRNVKFALKDRLCGKSRNLRLGDKVHLDTVGCADATLTDIRVVRRLDRLDVVIILTVEYLNGLHVVTVGR